MPPIPESSTDPASILKELSALAKQLTKAEQVRRVRLARRYDLAHLARAAGATWPQINAAAEVANMQSHLSGPRPVVPGEESSRTSLPD